MANFFCRNECECRRLIWWDSEIKLHTPRCVPVVDSLSTEFSTSFGAPRIPQPAPTST